MKDSAWLSSKEISELCNSLRLQYGASIPEPRALQDQISSTRLAPGAYVINLREKLSYEMEWSPSETRHILSAHL